MTLVSPTPEGGEPSNLRQPAAFNRRFLVTGAAGAGIVTAGYFSLVSAQEESGTPEAATDATPDATTASGTDTSEDAARVMEWIPAVRDRIASVQADRDAVAAEIDATQVDALLDQATALLDIAESALDGGTTAPALRYAEAAGRVASAARGSLVASLTYPGLPSQQAATSELFASAHERLTAVMAAAETVTTTDVTTIIEPAQALYATAFDQYAGGAYNQVAANGKVVQTLAAAAGTLLETGDAPSGDGPGRRGGPRSGERDDPGGFDRGDDATADEPVTVPEPDF